MSKKKKKAYDRFLEDVGLDESLKDYSEQLENDPWTQNKDVIKELLEIAFLIVIVILLKVILT